MAFQGILWILCLVHQDEADFISQNAGHTVVPHASISSGETKIDLYGNNIPALLANEFSVYTSLTELIMQQNSMTIVADSAF